MPITGDVFTRPTRRSVPVVVASSRRYISQRPIPGEADMNGRQRNRPNEPEIIPPGDMRSRPAHQQPFPKPVPTAARTPNHGHAPDTLRSGKYSLPWPRPTQPEPKRERRGTSTAKSCAARVFCCFCRALFLSPVSFVVKQHAALCSEAAPVRRRNQSRPARGSAASFSGTRPARRWRRRAAVFARA